ncbi:DUF3866 family protein [Kineococcus rhizosphaerae]|uniref:Uncharacterized protein DUF3866 n=1 Tax=Kineococcus rhizosphaerae TaxID=559628 RepID=A0A2T0RAF2_9ACTN|nr:DUF3866 family protein [Kineococcus rhizosphaerae]PRY18110.1 uncharacterized protein DUF3866 [Kineococcus rhizosphaerae]
MTITWRSATVSRLGTSWAGSVELFATLTSGPEQGLGVEVKALAHPDLVGTPVVGDRVLLNVSALARGLGTGGYALVVALPDRLPPDPPAGPGHLVKARYTPLQTMVLGADDQESVHHDVLAEADDLAGTPVVVADLHSAVPAVLAGLRAEAPKARAVYVMTDGGALPAAFSRAVAGLREAGWIAACVTTGQSFGGDLETATVHTGLLAARLVAGADVVVVAQGPGNLGTGSRWGFSGVAAGEALNAAAVLGGRPVAALRVSEADARSRHRGVSHHSLTAVGRVALAGVDVPVTDSPGAFHDGVRAQARALPARHRVVEVPEAGLDAALATSPVRLSTMGRGLDADRAAFLLAAAAGRHAGRLLG